MPQPAPEAPTRAVSFNGDDTPAVNIDQVAVSGHLIVSLQHGSWDTRPTVRVAEVGPRGIIEAGTWKPVWNVADIALEAATAVVAADGGLFTLDLNDPPNPTELSFIDLIDSQHLAVTSDRAFIATTGVSGNGWFDVVDISDPSAIQRLAGSTGPGRTPRNTPSTPPGTRWSSPTEEGSWSSMSTML